ncbi:MAG: M28 family peptidase [Flavobacteriales bacterium]
MNQKKEVKLSANTPHFDAEKSYGHIKTMVDFGPRVPQTPAHEKCQEFIQGHFMNLGLKVSAREGLKRAGKGLIKVKNIMASYTPKKAKKQLLFVSHYDTRYQSIDSIPEPVPGANDGASGIAVMMELARIIKTENLPYQIDFLCLDAQDQGMDNQIKTWSLGAQQWVKRNNKTYDFAINFDMLGAKDAKFVKEKFSSFFCKDLQDKIWAIAEQKGFQTYFPENNEVEQLINDHYFINNHSKSKVPTLLITDYRAADSTYFPQWHSKEDGLEHISTEPLQAVGQTVLELLYSKDF